MCVRWDGMGGLRPCPPVRDDIVYPRYLLFLPHVPFIVTLSQPNPVFPDSHHSFSQIIYDSNMAKLSVGNAAVHKNMPEVAGTLKWAQELKDRVTAPMKNLKRINTP